MDPRLVAAGLPDAASSPEGFASITLADIAAAGARLSGQSIDGSDGTSALAPGTFVVYRTSEGRYGKLQVLAGGYDLTIRVVKAVHFANKETLTVEALSKLDEEEAARTLELFSQMAELEKEDSK